MPYGSIRDYPVSISWLPVFWRRAVLFISIFYGIAIIWERDG
jgi:hypothetical protein